MPTWPVSFPPPAAGTLQESPPDNALRTSMDKGPDKIRRRTTANVRPLSFSIYLDDDQVQEMDEFYNEDTYSGSVEFDYVHPRTLANVSARFTAPPQYSHREAGLWTVNVSLEVLP